jgi:hypothetical protein
MRHAGPENASFGLSLGSRRRLSLQPFVLVFTVRIFSDVRSRPASSDSQYFLGHVPSSEGTISFSTERERSNSELASFQSDPNIEEQRFRRQEE